VVAAAETGWRVYERMLTSNLNKIAKIFPVSLFFGLGLLVTGTPVATPRLVLLRFADDFVAVPLATDRVGFSSRPDRGQVLSFSLVALAIAVPWIAFSFATSLVEPHTLGLGLTPTQTPVFVMLVRTGQATVYLLWERRHLWASRPSWWVLGATVADLVVVTLFVTRGVLRSAVRPLDVAVLPATVAPATVAVDLLKAPLLGNICSDAMLARGNA